MGIDEPLELLVLGATGRTGRSLVQQALERGHHVTALVRAPALLGGLKAGLVVRKASVLDGLLLRELLSKHDAVLSGLGHDGLGPDTILADSARVLVPAMKDAGVRRLLVVSLGMLFESAGFVADALRRTVFRNVADDSEAMERVVRDSDLEWTVARPPRLTNGRATHRYRAQDGALPKRAFSLARADLACFLLDEAERREHVRRVVGLASMPRQGLLGAIPRPITAEASR